MTPRNIIKEYIQHLLNQDTLYTKRITGVLKTEISSENIADLEALINLLEMHEESLKQNRRLLQLKQQSYLMTYMAEYAKNWSQANE